MQDLLTVFEASRGVMGKRRALHLPRMNVGVGDMLQALGEVACTRVRERVDLERNKRVARMVANWVKGATVDRALALDLRPDASLKAILERHIQNCWRPTYPAGALQGLNR